MFGDGQTFSHLLTVVKPALVILARGHRGSLQGLDAVEQGLRDCQWRGLVARAVLAIRVTPVRRGLFYDAYSSVTRRLELSLDALCCFTVCEEGLEEG